MPNAYTDTRYYSGQGVLLLGSKHATTGEPQGLLPVGNVPELTLNIGITKLQHRESQSGARGIDKVLATESSVTLNYSVEHFNSRNFETVLYGTNADVAAGTDVAANDIVAFHDKWSPMPHIGISSAVVKDDSDTTTYVVGTDYIVNESAGTIMALSTGSIGDGDVLHVTYDHSAQQKIDAVTSMAAPERWGRFEGLNTADDDSPVVLDFFKLSVGPMQNLGLIQNELANLPVETEALSDGTRSTGSKFFNMKFIDPA